MTVPVGRAFPQKGQPEHITIRNRSGIHPVTEPGGTGGEVVAAGSQPTGCLIRCGTELWKRGTLTILKILFLANHPSLCILLLLLGTRRQGEASALAPRLGVSSRPGGLLASRAGHTSMH